VRRRAGLSRLLAARTRAGEPDVGQPLHAD
jgi:hypothetical protein